MKSVVIYDKDMKKVAYLENATKVGYTKKLNTLWTGHFTLPADDPKNEYCQPFNYVEIFDEGKRVELFRILPAVTTKNVYGTITYQLEHVLATLIDDVLFQYHEVGGLGTYTNQIIQYILSRQTTQRWVLGQCDFGRQFQYNWENENLLSALLSIPKPFDSKYRFTYDTTVFPWVLNLQEIDMNQHPKSYIRYRKNQKSISRTIDPTNLCTRLFGLGYGEGVNQLTIAEVNGGLPYLEADTIGTYGIVSDIFVDRRFQDPASLKGRMEAILNERKHPKTTYEAEGADLYSIEGEPYGNFEEGTLVRVIDEELGIDTTQIIYQVSKSDITANPGDVKLTIANAAQDITTSFATMMQKQRINDVYAQGATNIDSYNFADNCDPDHPAVIKFFIPEEAVRINKLLLNYETSAFRAYSKAIEGGGGIATSTASGGGIATSTAAGGGAEVTSASGGSVRTTSGLDGGGFVFTSSMFADDPKAGEDGPVYTTEDGDPPHDHRLGFHKHEAIIGEHNHTVDIPSHRHEVDIPNHTHDITLPNHTHAITLPNHTHAIQHGIFLAPIFPSSVTVEVDGTQITGLGTNESMVDIIPYLSKDGSGKIRRGVWHEIKITPNTLGRIVADVTSQFFIQSRGGGDY